MEEIREALARSRTALQEAGGLAAEDQATRLQLAKTHLHQAHGALQMVDVEGVVQVTALAETALDRFKSGAVKCSADHVDAVTQLYLALVEYLEELLGGAPSQPARLYPYYRAVQDIVGAERIHPADLFFPDLARTVEPAPVAAQSGTDAEPDYVACRQRFERALLPYLKSTDAAQQRAHAAALTEAVAAVAAGQRQDKPRTFWLALQAFAELVAGGDIAASVPVKQLFGLINLQLRRLSQGNPAQPDAMLRDALFFVAVAGADSSSATARALHAAFALAGLVPPDYERRRYGQRDALAPAQARSWQDAPPAQTTAEIKEALRAVEHALDRFHADPQQRAGLTAMLPVLDALHATLADLEQPAAAQASLQVRAQLDTLATRTDQSGDLALQARTLDDVVHNVSALGFFAELLAHNAAGAHERYAYDAQQGSFRAVPFAKMPGAEAIPVLDQAVPAPAPAPPPELAAAAETAADAPHLLALFIAEARETLDGVDAALAGEVADRPADTRAPHGGHADEQRLIMLRRSFNTLKGSARAVALDDFADGAQAVERVLNTWLAEQRPANDALHALLERCARAVRGWTDLLADQGALAPLRDRVQALADDAARVLDGVTHAATAGGLSAPAPLLAIFFDEASALVDQLVHDFGAWRQVAQRPAAPQSLRAAHTLAGIAGTVGAAALRELALALEDTLAALQAPAAFLFLDQAQHDLFDFTAQRLQQMVATAGSGAAPAAQPELIAALAALRTQAQAAAPAANPALEAHLDQLVADGQAQRGAPTGDAQPVTEEPVLGGEASLGKEMPSDTAPPATESPLDAMFRQVYDLLTAEVAPSETPRAGASAADASASYTAAPEAAVAEAAATDAADADAADHDTRASGVRAPDESPLDAMFRQAYDLLTAGVPPSETPGAGASAIGASASGTAPPEAAAADAAATDAGITEAAAAEAAAADAAAADAANLDAQASGVPAPDEAPLDAMFRQVYAALSGSVPAGAAPVPAPGTVAAATAAPRVDDDIDDLFNAAFDEAFADPALQLAAPVAAATAGAALTAQPEFTSAANPGADAGGQQLPPAAPAAQSATHPDLHAAASTQGPPEAETQMEARTHDEAEAHAEMPAESQAKPETEAQPQPETESQAEPETESQPQPKTESQAEPETESQAEPQSNSQAEPHTAFQDRPQADAAAETEASSFHATAGAGITELPLAAAPQCNAAPAVFHDELDAELLAVFLEEGADLLPQVGEALRAWQAAPTDASHAQGLLRLLHTIKGSARMAGAMRLGQHVHDIETHIGNMVHGGAATPAAFDELLAHYDHALLLFEQLQQGGAPDAAPAAPSWADDQPAKSPLVRVRADILDRLVNQAGEVAIARARLEDQVGAMRAMLGDAADNLARLRRQLREIDMQAESQIASSMSRRADLGERDFDPLEFDRFTRLQELTRMMAESVNDAASLHEQLSHGVQRAGDDLGLQGRVTRDLQRDLMLVRMVPFASIAERLFRVARQSAKEVDKRVNLDLRGGSVEIDRGVLERMAAPLEHLLRNAIAHGVEARAARAAAGKSETGELLMEVAQQGNEMVIEFSDDGAGLDLERIRARGLATGLLAADEQVTDAQIADLIFEPGFTTAEALTALSGRGVGLDIVQAEAQSLGGRVDLESTPGQGTRFVIRLPLTLAVTQVVLVVAGGRSYALPAILVDDVQPMRAEALAAARASGHLTLHGRQAALHYLPALLGAGAASEAQAGESAPVMLLKNGAERLALQVDAVLGNREVVVKNIGPQLARMAGIAGATVLGSGDIVLILNPVALVQHLAQHPEARAQYAQAVHDPAGADPACCRATVMVVDDSMTVRRVTARLLEREGYRVLLANDGVDALEQLRAVSPDLLLVDIEMPRMDGFDLMRQLRANPQTAATPVIMITSRSADKHRNHALTLGVDAFFGKPFQEPALLAAMQDLLTRRQA